MADQDDNMEGTSHTQTTPTQSPSASTHPPTQIPTTAAAKRKQRDRSGSPQATSSKKARRSRPESTRKVKPGSFHIKVKNLPQDSDGAKRAMEIHICAMWGLPDRLTVPPDVDAALFEVYRGRFTSDGSINDAVKQAMFSTSGINAVPDVVNHLIKACRSAANTSTGSIAGNILRIRDEDLRFVFGTVAAAGLDRWAPDVSRLDPDSSYNILHERLAISTFRQLVIGGAYHFCAIHQPLLTNDAFLRTIYRNYVWHYKYKMYEKEKKEAGSAVRDSSLNSVFKRRKKLQKSRVAILKAHSFDPTVIALAKHCAAHSDDEGADDAEKYIIHDKEGRSDKVKLFFRMLDDEHAKMKRRTPGNKSRKKKVVRLDPEEPLPSQLPALPRRVPLDWFDPLYWNTTLTIAEKARFIKKGVLIALPGAEHVSSLAKCVEWRNLSADEFMERYGNEVMKEYNMPTKEQLEMLAYDDESDSDPSDSDADET